MPQVGAFITSLTLKAVIGYFVKFAALTLISPVLAKPRRDK